MQMNILKLTVSKLLTSNMPRTHEGALTTILSDEQALRRSVLACMLWEQEFYESGETIATVFACSFPGLRRPRSPPLLSKHAPA